MHRIYFIRASVGKRVSKMFMSYRVHIGEEWQESAKTRDPFEIVF